MSKRYKVKQRAFDKKDIVDNIAIILDTEYKPVSVKTIAAVIDAYDRVLLTRLLEGFKITTGLGRFFLKVHKPKVKELQNIKTKEKQIVGGIPHYLLQFVFHKQIRKEIFNLPVSEEDLKLLESE